MDDQDASEAGCRPVRFVLYFPLKNTAQKRAEALLSSVEDHLCRIFGGLTSYPAKGLYLNEESASIQRESVQALEVYATPGAWAKSEEEMNQLAAVVARALGQESVAMSVDGVLMFKAPGDHREAGDWPWFAARPASEV